MEESLFKKNILKAFLLAVFANIIILVVLTQLIEGEFNSTEDKLIQGITIKNVKLRPKIPEPEEIREKEPEQKKEEIIKPKPEKLYTKTQKFDFEMPSFELNPNLKATGFSIPLNRLTSADHSKDQMISFDELDKIPVPRYKKPPVYPYRAKRMGIEGEVSISFVVHRDGSVSDIKILKAKPEGIFEQSVMDAVSSWKYSPGELMGENVKTLVRTNIVFKLEE